MRIRYFSTLISLLFSFTATAQTSVWSTDVAPIIYNRCATCHRDGGIAPFPLTSYEDAIAHTASIRVAVKDGSMPPWPPDPAYNRLAHERVLSSVEKSKIMDWLAGGTPRGNAALEPPTPRFPDKGELPGTPDLIVRIPNYSPPATGGDVYRCFVLPTGLSADKFITAFEALPGNRAMVHHVLVFADTTGITTQLDSLDPGPRYMSFGGIGTDASLIGGWTPGATPTISPAAFGLKLPKNARLVVQIHYPEGTAGMVDSTELHFFFSPAANLRPLMLMPLLNHAYNITEPLFIPANTVKTFVEKQPVRVDFILFGVLPHMHLLGSKIESFAVAPSGDTDRYISIPKWEFHWQGYYMFRQAKKIAAGSTAYALATYDNTANNPENPSNPPQDVREGENSTDEMMMVFFLFANYQPGDEQITIDSSVTVGVQGARPYYSSVELLQPYPIPANQQLVVKYHLDAATTGSVNLTNMAGQTMLQVCAPRQMQAGYTALPVDVSKLPSGVYTLRLNARGQVKTCTVNIQH